MSRKRVVGVKYDPDDKAPVVVVKGAGEAADAVLDQAVQQTGLPVVRDAALVDKLYRVPIDAAIGRDLFPVMAALLAHTLFIDATQQEG